MGTAQVRRKGLNQRRKENQEKNELRETGRKAGKEKMKVHVMYKQTKARLVYKRGAAPE
jgi:hypothetical protein